MQVIERPLKCKNSKWLDEQSIIINRKISHEILFLLLNNIPFT